MNNIESVDVYVALKIGFVFGVVLGLAVAGLLWLLLNREVDQNDKW